MQPLIDHGIFIDGGALIANGGMGFGLVVFLAIIVMAVGAFGLAVKILFGMARWLFGGSSDEYERHPRGGEWREAMTGPSARLCRSARCGQANPPMAVYCGRCGKRL
jgi:hypothetical protein